MSEKQLSYPTRKRLPRIIEGLIKGENYDQIAEAVGVKNRRTIERDIQAWRATGGFEDFFAKEFLKLHGKIRKSDPVEAYRQITKLIARTLTRKIEAQLKQQIQATMIEPTPMPWEQVPEVKARLDVLKEQMRAEKEAEEQALASSLNSDAE
ncbi:helix-turn-helix domain-containing protein [Candidatus Bathyarchaeota archaeon]|nr:helix-turn-helix domain-containing protein [Candidatus Bathyarchaeota archaeon]